jgi:hypothetical protein
MIKNLKEKLFGKKQLQPNATPLPSPAATKKSSSQIAGQIHSGQDRKEPYFIQIGFDFGTTYSKCVCRDVMTNKAWVHLHPRFEGQELPFLIPSALMIEDGRITHVEDHRIHYPENGLYHLKHALVKAALGDWKDPALAPYCSAAAHLDIKELPRFVEACAVYFLAGTLGEVLEQMRQRYTGFGMLPQDYIAVNLAVPVADVEQPAVNELFNRIIREAWSLADQLCGYPKISFADLELLRKKTQKTDAWSMDEVCFIYPEVSANVQGFVRSRVSSPGTYLFSDTGGGTVDQSVFIFFRRDGEEYLTYLHGSVLPVGSSLIERIAAMSSGSTDRHTLEMWRMRKEDGGREPELQLARSKIESKLKRGTQTTLAWAIKKIYVKEQLHDIRIIFGGGGYCDYPYKTAVVWPFSGSLFPRGISPDIVGLPIPRDLELGDQGNRWMRRLYVAYGLSFVKIDLAKFTYPKDVRDPKPDEILTRDKILPDAPTKDVC